MRVGGNKQMRQFFADQGFPKTLTIEQKYHSEAAGLYRERIKQLAEGANPATLKPIATIGYKDEAAGAAYSANGSGGMTQPIKSRADSVGSSGGYSSGGGGSSRSDRAGSFQDDGDSQSSRPKMTGFGSNGQSHSQHAGSDSASADFFGSLSSSFFSAAKYTQQAVAQTAAVVGPKLSQAGATIKAKTVETTEQLKQKDLVSSAAQKTAAGWSAVTSFVGGYVAPDTNSQPPRQGKYASFGSDSLDADGNPKPIQPASSQSSSAASSEGGLFGLPRPEGLGTGKKYEGLGSEQFHRVRRGTRIRRRRRGRGGSNKANQHKEGRRNHPRVEAAVAANRGARAFLLRRCQMTMKQPLPTTRNRIGAGMTRRRPPPLPFARPVLLHPTPPRQCERAPAARALADVMKMKTSHRRSR